MIESLFDSVDGCSTVTFLKKREASTQDFPGNFFKSSYFYRSSPVVVSVYCCFGICSDFNKIFLGL